MAKSLVTPLPHNEIGNNVKLGTKQNLQTPPSSKFGKVIMCLFLYLTFFLLTLNHILLASAPYRIRFKPCTCRQKIVRWGPSRNGKNLRTKNQKLQVKNYRMCMGSEYGNWKVCIKLILRFDQRQKKAWAFYKYPIFHKFLILSLGKYLIF